MGYPEEISTDPFKNLMITVLSQNTSEVNCVRAYRGLAARFEVKPEVLARAKTEDIKEVSGAVASTMLNRRGLRSFLKQSWKSLEGISSILALPKEEARKRLMKLPGISKKTADVLLAQRHSYAEVMFVGTHMERIAKRLGLVKPNAKYEEIQKALKAFIPWEKEREQEACYGFWQNTLQSSEPKMP